MTSDNFYKLLDQYNQPLRKVTLKLDTESIDLCYRPFTTDKHRDCQHRSIIEETITEINGDKTIKKRLDEYKYMANIVFMQSLDSDGNRIFNNITDTDKLIKKMPYTKLAQLASVMGANIDKEIEEAIHG